MIYLMVGSTIYPQLIDILIRFRTHSIALTADIISTMYRTVELAPEDRDLHHFVWRDNPVQDFKEFWMIRITFGVSASLFAAFRTLQQMATDFGSDFPDATSMVFDSFCVDDCVTGASSVQEATTLQQQL